MEVKFKKLTPTAMTPYRAHEGDAGLDLYADEVIIDGDCVTYKSGLAFEIPNGYVGLLFPRSSNANKDLFLSNSVGVIDSCYRGDVMAKFKIKSCSASKRIYLHGERFAQLIIMPYPKIELIETSELSETDRGADGYGKSGK